MSGVVDERGQWEHCNACGKMVLIGDLRYETPSGKFAHGRDLCVKCMKFWARFHIPLVRAS